MPAFRFNGYVIVSADGMLADASGVMPDTLKFPGDLAFFTAGLDRADLIVHGRHSFEDQPNSPKRKRIIVSRSIAAIGPDPENNKATLWNPAGASFEDACAHAGVHAGTVAVIGGPSVFEMFFDRIDVFWLSQAPHVRLPGGEGCFPGVPERSPQDILSSHGLQTSEVQILDSVHEVTVTAWRRVS
ncbi:dihydrofolate reductase family protein [Tardiphaga robiniae]|uniref:Dihydrofolate reductase n=1 Tax=Tardiphaga robiniae TaxID=943830 RepID=A0A7G6TXQ0_9BRAD|nr:dihydrofolate reductase [Tardiphaga robiniae]QND71532.1 dihydrofolate reductase [Tardiphaga robiniae]